MLDVCGIIHTNGGGQPHDAEGCVLPSGHDSPHEFVATDGERWQWETDLECACDWCMKCEGDYCTIYWRKADSGGEIEYQSWLAALASGVDLPPVHDAVWEALQRLIENAASLGPSSQEDAMVVARWRGQFVAARERAARVGGTDGR